MYKQIRNTVEIEIGGEIAREAAPRAWLGATEFPKMEQTPRYSV